MSKEHEVITINGHIPSDLHPMEVERRIAKIKSNLDMLEQMSKIPNLPATHRVFCLRSIASDALGIRGEIEKI